MLPKTAQGLSHRCLDVSPVFECFNLDALEECQEMKLTKRLLGATVAVLLAQGIPGWGQETRAILGGTVSDPQGSAVPAAKIEIRNLETNVVTSTQTNGSGTYTAPPINPGTYSVTVTAAGFKVAVKSNLELRSSDRKAVDFGLQIGAATETVSVTAEAPLLDNVTASRSSTINQSLVEAVPTYAKNVFQLTRYTAGASGGTTVRPFDGGDNGVSILGGNNNEVLLNGSPNTYRETTGAANTISPPPDAVGEVKIITNVYDAELGRTGGGVVSVSIKSGTNQYHGSVSWLMRNPALNANTFEANATGAPNASFRMNEPGVELDGPFTIPKLYNGKNRTFFTFAEDIYRDNRPTGNTLTSPTLLERSGDFSRTYVSGTSGAAIAIYDPLTTLQSAAGAYTRTPFAGSVIPPSRINPIAANLAKFYLTPNQIAARTQPNVGVYPNYDHEPFNSYIFRFDHKLSEKQNFFINFMRDLRGQTNGGGAGLPAFQAQGTEFASNSFSHYRGNIAGGITLTSVLSPSMVNTARTSWNRHVFGISYYAIGYDPAKLGFPSSLSKQIQTVAFPQISVANYFTLGGGNSTLNYSNNFVVGDTLTKTVGKHTWKFGGEFRNLMNNQSSPPASFVVNASAGFTQANPLVANAQSGDAMASFLLGYPSSVSSSFNSFPAQGQHYFSGFAQDDWRIARKLTLNLGGRWEYESPITDRFDQAITGFDSSTVSRVGSANGPAIKGGLLFASNSNRLPYKRDLNNFAPRVGLAYQVMEKMVIRSGWGITYTPTADIAPTTGFSYATAPATSVSAAGIEPLVTPGCSGANCGMLANPFPTGILAPPGRSLGLLTNVGQGVSFISPTRVMPYSHTVSFGVQYQLPFRSVIEISYNGRFGRALPSSYNRNSVTAAQYLQYGAALTGTSVANPYANLLPGTGLNGATITLQQSLLPYTQFTGVTESNMSLGSSKYQSFVFQFEKRLSRGLSVMMNGTLGKSTTYNSYLNNGLDAPGQFITRDGGTPPHVFNLVFTYTENLFNKQSRLVKTILNGWQVSGYSQWISGGLLNVGGAYATGINPTLGERTFKRWFNTCTLNQNTNLRQNCVSDSEPVAWLIQKPFTLNTEPVPQWSDFRGRAVPEVSLSFFKRFVIKERIGFELRMDANNATNQATFGAPNTTATSSLFGVTTLQQGFSYSSIGPRQIQLGAKINF